MPMTTTMWITLLMAAIAVVNSSLMAWLWRFPMKTDPSGRSPDGIWTAPRVGINIHRGLGYIVVLSYVGLLVEMLPRIWEFATGTSVAHGIFGVLVGVLLIAKIAVIRRFRSFGHRLPWIGGFLLLMTLATAALRRRTSMDGVAPVWAHSGASRKRARRGGDEVQSVPRRLHHCL